MADIPRAERVGLELRKLDQRHDRSRFFWSGDLWVPFCMTFAQVNMLNCLNVTLIAYQVHFISFLSPAAWRKGDIVVTRVVRPAVRPSGWLGVNIYSCECDNS